MTTDSTDKHWYVLRAIFKKEIAVRDGLRRAGFHCYVPMDYRLETVQGRKVRRLIPAVTELVFVYANEEAINDYKLHSKETVYWVTRPHGHKHVKITVPDKAMEDFIRVTQQMELSITYFRPDELILNKGDRILIHGGPFDGIEGVMMKVKGKREKQLIVSIPHLAAAAVTIMPDMVELISKTKTTSRNCQQDTRELIHLSTQMLTAAPDRVSQAMEYDMMYQTIRRLYKSLLPIRGYLPALEGELSLALLMAEDVTDVITPQTRDRFKKALSNLSDRSLLKVRMQLIGGTLLNDLSLLNQSQSMITRWKNDSLSINQRHIIEEADSFAHIIDRP